MVASLHLLKVYFFDSSYDSTQELGFFLGQLVNGTDHKASHKAPLEAPCMSVVNLQQGLATSGQLISSMLLSTTRPSC